MIYFTVLDGLNTFKVAKIRISGDYAPKTCFQRTICGIKFFNFW